jgi:hypothetical protein
MLLYQEGSIRGAALILYYIVKTEVGYAILGIRRAPLAPGRNRNRCGARLLPAILQILKSPPHRLRNAFASIRIAKDA